MRGKEVKLKQVGVVSTESRVEYGVRSWANGLGIIVGKGAGNWNFG